LTDSTQLSLHRLMLDNLLIDTQRSNLCFTSIARLSNDVASAFITCINDVKYQCFTSAGWDWPSVYVCVCVLT